MGEPLCRWTWGSSNTGMGSNAKRRKCVSIENHDRVAVFPPNSGSQWAIFVQFPENIFLEEHYSRVKKQRLSDVWKCSKTFVHTAGPG